MLHGKTVMTSLVYKNKLRTHSRYGDDLTNQLEIMDDNSFVDQQSNATSIYHQIFEAKKQSENESNEKI